MASVYKYRSDINRDLLTIVNNQIYAASKKELNDPIECVIDFSDILEKIDFMKRNGVDDGEPLISEIRNIKTRISELGVFSLSKTAADNALMWSHYGNGHRGFCVEYDFDLLKKDIMDQDYHSIFEVDYIKNVFALKLEDAGSLIENDASGFIKKLSATKHEDWKYEMEVRMNFYTVGLKEVSCKSVTGIYFGAFMRDDDKDKIKRTLRHKNIKYYQMKLKPSSFELEYEEIK